MALVDAAGRAVVLGKRLGRGGEGEVFEVEGRPDMAAKILHPSRSGGKADKVRQMVAHPPAGAYDLVEGHPVLTWPRELLQDATQGAVGYTMARISTQDFVPFFRLTTASRRRGMGGSALTWDRQLLLASRLCHLVRTLHRFGYAVGDLNDRNVLVSRRLTPLLMDTDSFQVPRAGRGHHPSIVGDQLYWPPELLDVDLSRHKEGREVGDRFALGVLLFQLFMDGLRPYQARGSLVDGLETVADKTRAGHYPWADPRPGRCEPPASAPSYTALPRPLRDAVYEGFVEGHRKPSRRPTADEWYTVLNGLMANGFATCAKDARHVHPATDTTCPWCGDPNDRYAPTKARPRPSPVHAPRRLVLAPLPRAKAQAQASKPAKTRAAPPVAAAAPTVKTSRPKATRAVLQPVPSLVTAAPSLATVSKPPIQAPPIRLPPTAPARPSTRPAKASKQTTSRRPRPPTSRQRSKASVPKAARSRRGKARTWRQALLRAAWVAFVAMAFLVPVLLLLTASDGLDKSAVAATSGVSLVAGAGGLAAWRWGPPKRGRLATTWAWLTFTACGGAYLVASRDWSVLSWVAALGWATVGAGLFTWLELRERRPFRPDARGWLHTAAGLPVAAVPVILLWAWRALG